MLWFPLRVHLDHDPVHVLSDLFRDHSLSGVTKTPWVLFLVSAAPTR
jgi:hypothetical protein